MPDRLYIAILSLEVELHEARDEYEPVRLSGMMAAIRNIKELAGYSQ